MVAFIVFILALVILVLAVKNLVGMKKDKKSFFENNPKFKNGKKFSLAGLLNVYVCEDGDIAFMNTKAGSKYSIINIKDIRDWDIIQDGESSKKLGGAVLVVFYSVELD